jgi:predicted RNase H-like nuclease (RuvC/YqgF family)
MRREYPADEIERLTKKIEVQGRNVKALVKIAITKDHQIERLNEDVLYLRSRLADATAANDLFQVSENAEIERLKRGWSSESDKFIADLRGAYAKIKRLWEALEFIAEAHDAGRHDGLPEECPAHDAETMFSVARATIAKENP